MLGDYMKKFLTVLCCVLTFGLALAGCATVSDISNSSSEVIYNGNAAVMVDGYLYYGNSYAGDISSFTELSEIDSDIISSISEIEYNPDIKDEVTINEGRFILRMNDGNHIYIDIVNFENLNKYKIIYSSLDEKGVLHLDVVYSENNTITFTSFAALAAQQNSEEGEDNELSQ